MVLLISCNYNNIDLYFNQIINEISYNVTEEYVLPEKVDNYEVTYESNSDNVTIVDGVISSTSFDEKVTITIIIEIDGVKYTKDFDIVIKKSENDYITSGLNKLKDIFDDYDEECYTTENYQLLLDLYNEAIDKIKNSSSESVIDLIIDDYIFYFNEIETEKSLNVKLIEIEEDLNDILLLSSKVINSNINLKQTSLYDSIIVWTSSNEDVLSSDGVVKKGVSNTKVTLSYNVILDGITYEGNTITIYVETSINLSSYYSSINLSKRGYELKKDLRELITSTHKKNTTYDDLRTKLALTDVDPNNSNNFIDFYSHISCKSTWDKGNSWNREHVWPQSRGWFTTSGAGSDIHHIRPVISNINSTRGNAMFTEINSRDNYQKKYNGVLYGYMVGQNYFEPIDEVKGDVARILLYLFVRYKESDNYQISVIISSVDMLLKWNELDPVDDLEIKRNEVAYSIQGNRNPFIDYPDFANMIYLYI